MTMAETTVDAICRTPLDVIHALDRAFMGGDVERIVSLYEAQALVLPQPGVQARGLEAIRRLYEDFAAQGARVQQQVERVLEADGVALYLSRWKFLARDGSTWTAVSTVVLRRQPDGGWKVLIDNARGPALLDEGAVVSEA